MTVPILVFIAVMAGLVLLTVFTRKLKNKTKLIINGAISLAGIAGTLITSFMGYDVSVPVLEDFWFFRKVTFLSAGLILLLMTVHGVRVLTEGETNKYGRFLLNVVPTLGAGLVLMLSAVSCAYFYTGVIKWAVLLLGVFEALALRLPETISLLGCLKKEK